MKLLLTIILVLCVVDSKGQRYATADIIRQADSLVITMIGAEVFREHYQLDSSSLLYYQNIFHHEIKRSLLFKKHTPKRLKYVDVHYTFHVTKGKQPAVFTSVLFDKNLHLLKPIDTAFIPGFILRRTLNTMLTEQQALTLGRSKFQKKGIKPVEVSLNYDYQRKAYVWTLVNTLEEWWNGTERSREIELLEVDAVNGAVLSFASVLEAPLH